MKYIDDTGRISIAMPLERSICTGFRTNL